jgi:WD40 repeat protein
LWDAATGAELKALALATTTAQFGGPIALSPDGQRIASVMGQPMGMFKTVRITDVATGAEVHTLNAPDVMSLDFSPDGRRLATFAFMTGNTGVVKVWDTASGQELLTFKDSKGWMSQPAGFSADGHSLYALYLSPASESLLKIWDATPLPEPNK